jgi:hypothetical protein
VELLTREKSEHVYFSFSLTSRIYHGL